MNLKLGNETVSVEYSYRKGDPGSRDVAPTGSVVEIDKIEYKGVEVTDLLFELAPDIFPELDDKILDILEDRL